MMRTVPGGALERRIFSARRGSNVLLLACAIMLGSSARAAPSTATRMGNDTTLVTIRSVGIVLAFEPDRITVTPGAVVRIRYVNESNFTHNMVILRNEDDIDTVGAASFQAAETGFVPMQYKSRMIAYSPLAAAGQTVEFTFEAPAPGEYPFACFVDGHFNMMVGTLRSR